MSEHRVSARNRTLLPAQIEIYDSGVRLECLIKDLSSTGARLSISDAVAVPKTFLIHIPKLQRAVRASIQWRKGGMIGVAFDEPEPNQHGGHGSDDEIRIHKLEAEVTRLKRTLEAIRADPSQARLILERT